MFAVIFDVEQAGFLPKLAEPRDKKKTNRAFGFDGKQETPDAPRVRRANLAKNLVGKADF
jgi:hypothetical protein